MRYDRACSSSRTKINEELNKPMDLNAVDMLVCVCLCATVRYILHCHSYSFLRNEKSISNDARRIGEHII